MTEPSGPSGLERVLNLLTTVRPGEARTALLLALNVFMLLMAYYILKTVREALILGEGTAELKSYLSAGQVAVLAVVVPFYGRLVARFPRITLINVVTVFFVGCPVVFYLLAQVGVPLGMIYFVWIGIFSLMIVAQFWSFANDVYSKEEGERLLVIVGLGASLGAVAGARVADRLIEPIGVLELMLLGAAVLAAQLLLTNYIDRIERARRLPAAAPAAEVKARPAPVQNAFAMVVKTRYLLLMALMILIVNWINATGEYILGSIVKEQASAMIAAGTAGGLTEGQIIGDFYAKYFSLANLTGLFLQLFVVSRVIKYGGVGVALMILPALSFGVYNILIFVPLLNAALAAKVLENSTDYSLNNTVRNMLFLPCTYEQKFAAKQAIDSFFVRMGDVLSAVLVFAGSALALPSRGFAAINAALAVVALILAYRVGRHYRQRTAAGSSPAVAA